MPFAVAGASPFVEDEWKKTPVHVCGAVYNLVGTGTAVTLTAQEAMQGFIWGAETAARTLTLPTATQLLEALPKSKRVAGARWDVDVQNGGSTATYVVTLASGAGVSVLGATLIAGAAHARLVFICTDATPGAVAFSCYNLTN